MHGGKEKWVVFGLIFNSPIIIYLCNAFDLMQD
jgi:Sec-independent protein secretion pathway component TatC